MIKVIKISTGDTIILRHLKKSDIDGIWKNFNDVLEEGIYLPVFTPVKSDIEKKSWYDNIIRDHEICIVAENPDLKSPNNIIGQCEISNLEWEASTHVGSLGVIITQKYRDLGIGFHLIDFTIRQAKNLNNKSKIILSCFSNNERALHLYKKMNFKIIGMREKQFYMEGIYYDEVLMELFVDDYIEKNNQKN